MLLRVFALQTDPVNNAAAAVACRAWRNAVHATHVASLALLALISEEVAQQTAFLRKRPNLQSLTLHCWTAWDNSGRVCYEPDSNSCEAAADTLLAAIPVSLQQFDLCEATLLPSNFEQLLRLSNLRTLSLETCVSFLITIIKSAVLADLPALRALNVKLRPIRLDRDDQVPLRMPSQLTMLSLQCLPGKSTSWWVKVDTLLQGTGLIECAQRDCLSVRRCVHRGLTTYVLFICRRPGSLKTGAARLHARYRRRLVASPGEDPGPQAAGLSHCARAYRRLCLSDGATKIVDPVQASAAHRVAYGNRLGAAGSHDSIIQ